MPRTTFVKIDTTAHSNYFLQTVLKDDGNEGFHLTVTDGEHIWSGDVSEDDIDTLSTKAKMNFQDFVSITVKAFTQEAVSSMHFEFDLKQGGDNSLKLIWKKHIPVDDIKFQLGSAILHREDESAKSIRHIFQQCITRMTSLQEKIRSVNTDNERLSQERAMALRRLDKCISAKEELEKDLYEKFVAVLNSKKEKIRALKRQMSERSLAGPSTSKMSDESDVEDVKNGVTSSSVGASTSMQEEENTDDESAGASKKRRRGRAAHASKRDADTSLVLDDEDDVSTTVARRPARRRPATKKQTPAKPILPKVKSRSDGSSVEGRRSNMRKSSSHSSNRSSENNDPDDIMADLE